MGSLTNWRNIQWSIIADEKPNSADHRSMTELAFADIEESAMFLNGATTPFQNFIWF